MQKSHFITILHTLSLVRTFNRNLNIKYLIIHFSFNILLRVITRLKSTKQNADQFCQRCKLHKTNTALRMKTGMIERRTKPDTLTATEPSRFCDQNTDVAQLTSASNQRLVLCRCNHCCRWALVSSSVAVARRWSRPVSLSLGAGLVPVVAVAVVRAVSVAVADLEGEAALQDAGHVSLGVVAALGASAPLDGVHLAQLYAVADGLEQVAPGVGLLRLPRRRRLQGDLSQR